MSKNFKNLKVRATALALLATQMVTLCSCEKELAADENYAIVQQVESENGIVKGLTQELDVPGNDFKLVTEYSCDDSSKREWRITSDKFLYFNVYTKGLPKGTQVYIDNIHIDTSIKSKYACMDGILQDSMDDHIHNSALIGFPVSDSIYYYGVNAIEGCNETFIKGSFYGMKGYSSGTVSEKRYTESDYLELGVYANKIQIVYDLLIKGKDDTEFSNVSVSTDFLVPVSSKTKYDNEEEKTYTKSK